MKTEITESYRTIDAGSYFADFGPIVFAIEFTLVVILISVLLYSFCKKNSAVFWKRTDYVYFLFTIIGGAAGAADIAYGSWAKEQQSIEMAIISGTLSLNNSIASVLDVCNGDIESKRRFDDLNRELDTILDKASNATAEEKNKLKSILFDGMLITFTAAQCNIASDIKNDVRIGNLKELKSYYDKKDLGKNFSMSANVESNNYSVSYTDEGSGGAMSRVVAILHNVFMVQVLQNNKKMLDEKINRFVRLLFLKNISPILLGLGVGVRLARTHYDVKSEELKAAQLRETENKQSHTPTLPNVGDGDRAEC